MVTKAEELTPDPAPVVAPDPADILAPPVLDDDPDNLELQEALNAVKAEEAAAKGEPAIETKEGGEGAPAEPPVTPDTGKAAPVGEGDKDTPMIPKARFDEVNNAKNTAEQSAAYWRGVAEARAAAQTAAQPNTPPVETTEQKLQAVRADKLAAAKKFDAGELSAEQWEAEKQALDDREWTIRQQEMVEKTKPAAPPAQPSPQDDSLYLETLTAKLETDHPYVAEITRESDFNWLMTRAREDLVASGGLPEDGKPETTLQIYNLRKRIAELSDEFGPQLTGKTLGEPGKAPAPSGQPAAKPSLSPEALARAAKLELQGTLPPDLTQMGGTPGNPSGELTDAQIEGMDDEEIAAAMARIPSLRNKLLGVT